MKCPECGEKLENGARYCNKCAAIFPKPLYEEEPEEKKEIAEVVDEGAPEEENAQKKYPPEIWLYIISALIPFAGIVTYFIYKKNNPKVARNCLIISVVIFIIGRLMN